MVSRRFKRSALEELYDMGCFLGGVTVLAKHICVLRIYRVYIPSMSYAFEFLVSVPSKSTGSVSDTAPLGKNVI